VGKNAQKLKEWLLRAGGGKVGEKEQRWNSGLEQAGGGKVSEKEQEVGKVGEME
jgi:hypothetical protein